MQGLPKLLDGHRRVLMSLLVGTGIALAALTGATALLMMWLLGAEDTQVRVLAAAGLLLAALGIGSLRAAERVLAEKLGQHYVQQIRTGLLEAALSAERGPAAGITIARTTNDLMSVRNWIVQGIAPLAVGVPLIIGTAAALWMLAPSLAIAVVVPLVGLTAALALLAKPAFERARTLRRRRGRLAAQIADTVAAAPGIKAAGGTEREVRRIDKLGGRVAEAAVHRARTAGYIRGSAAVAASVGVAAVAAAGTWQGVGTNTIAAALTIVGLIATPVSDMGRVVEYRQNFKAARRILAPALAAGAAAHRERRPQAPPPSALVSILGIPTCGNCEVPPLTAEAGEVVVVRSADPAHSAEVIERALGLRSTPAATTWVDGVDILSLSPLERRRRTGYAAAGSLLERGTIARAVRYRRPELDAEAGSAALERVGLRPRLSQLPDGEHTHLTRGGDPLSDSDRARLLIARASIGEPALLIINRMDTDLDDDGRIMLADLIRDYPGVVLVVPGSADPPGITRVWRLDCPHRALKNPGCVVTHVTA